jgi:hypothetical protein
MLNLESFSEIGLTPVFESSAFKKIRNVSKLPSISHVIHGNYFSITNSSQNFERGSGDLDFIESVGYGLRRQSSFLTKQASLAPVQTLFDNRRISQISGEFGVTQFVNNGEESNSSSNPTRNGTVFPRNVGEMTPGALVAMIGDRTSQQLNSVNVISDILTNSVVSDELQSTLINTDSR